MVRILLGKTQMNLACNLEWWRTCRQSCEGKFFYVSTN